MNIPAQRLSFPVEAEALCGEMMTLGMPQSGESAGSGSWLCASSAAPPSFPLRRASISAASFTTSPRPMLISLAPFFMRLNESALMRSSVSFVSGHAMTIQSARASSSGSFEGGCISSTVPSGFSGLRRTPMTLSPNVRA
ncbi:hypothetical protein D3C83_10570 [compost metagenome]